MNSPDDDPDAELLPLIAAGNARAVQTLLSRHSGWVWSLARRMLGDDMAAEDVVQEVFTRAWKQAGTWQTGQAKFATWMRRVAVNLCYDRLRKKREELPGDLPEQTDAGLQAGDALMRDERRRIIVAAMARLPERQKAALILGHFQEMSQADAAESLNISVRAYESLLARARRSLRAELDGQKDLLLSGYGESR